MKIEIIEEKKMKRVTFDSNVQIHNMHVWAFAYREARKSDLAKIKADRFRFNLRIERLEEELVKIGFFSRK